MGKKSRRPNRIQASASSAAAAVSVAPTVTATAQQPVTQPVVQQQQQQQPAVFYASDGPSDLELIQTKSASLQAKLDQLTTLGLANDRKTFVEQFVPLDLSPDDTAAYLQDLTTAEEAEGQWTNLISEIAAIRCGKGVNKIEGDQITRAVFYFNHPLFEKMEREVAFICTDGQEWRAEG